MILVNLMQTVLRARVKSRRQRAKYRARYPEKVKAEYRAWAKANPARVRELKRIDYARNPEPKKAAAKIYRRDHPETARLALMRYRTRRRKANGYATADQIRARVAFFGWACSYCGGTFEHLDHAISVSRGGTNWPANIRPACQPCNQSKGAKSAMEFLAQRRQLTPR